MAKYREKFKSFVMSFSYQERKRQELLDFKDELERLKCMEIDEIDLEYINMKSEYEYKKNILSIFLIAILISVFMGVWNRFFILIENIVQYANSHPEGGAEAAKVLFACCLVLMGFITIVILGILLIHIRRMHHIYKRLLIIDKAKSKNISFTKK